MSTIFIKPNSCRIVIIHIWPIIFTSILMIGVSLFNEISQYFIVIVVILFFVLVFYVYQLGMFLSLKYRITEKSLIEEFKFITQGEKVIPFSEITDIGFSKIWILDSLFKTGSLSVSTSGSGGHDGVLLYINKSDEMYELLNSKLKLSKSIDLNNSGEMLGSHQKIEKSDLEERIQPSAGIATIITFLPGIIFWFYVVGNIVENMAIILAPIITLFQSIFVYFSYKKMYFDFYNDKIEYYDGFLNKNKKTLSYQRITDIVHNKNIIDRFFNVSRIYIQTAGSSIPEISILFVKNGESIVVKLKEVLKKHGNN